MRACTTTILAVTLMGSSAFALPQYAARATTGGSFTDFQAPGDGDVRSPCPALNALANHGFLPRNGKGITMPILTAAIDEAFNVGADFAQLTGGFALKHNTGPPNQAFTLEELNLHNSIEHDGSLSRSDDGDAAGDNHTFNQTAFDTILAAVPEGQDTFDIQSAATGRRERIISEHSSDPNFLFSAKSALLSYAETALYLSVLDSPKTNSPPVDYVKILFQEERLPYAEGWRRTDDHISVPTLLGIAVKLQQSAPISQQIQQAAVITQGTFESIFKQ